jgi:cell division topological specificity factor
MNLFKLFARKPATAPVARERLQILLAHERRSARDADLIAVLQKEVLAAISKHIAINPEKVGVKMHRGEENLSMLEIEIEFDGDVAKDDAENDQQTGSNKEAA